MRPSTIISNIVSHREDMLAQRRITSARFVVLSTIAIASAPAAAQNAQGLISGFIGAAMVAGAQSAWKQLPPLELSCMSEALERGAHVTVPQLVQRGVAPTDPRLAQVRAGCDQVIDRKFGKNVACSFPVGGQTISTFCDQSYAVPNPNGGMTAISMEQAIDRSVTGQPVQIGQFERQDALARRRQMSQAGVKATQVIAPNFDCGKAHTARETTICNSYELSDLDHTYGQYWLKVTAIDKKHKAKRQIEKFYRDGEKCGPSADCIRAKLISGIDYLADLLKAGGVQVATYEESQAEKQKEEAAAKAQVEQEQLRRQAQAEAAQKAAEEQQKIAAAKAEQEQKERDVQQARQVAIAQAEAEKAKAEVEKAEELAAAANAAEAPADTRNDATTEPAGETSAQSSLAFLIAGKPARILGIGLGDGPDACAAAGGTIEKKEWGSTDGTGGFTAYAIMNMCDVQKSAKDTAVALYDSSGAHVVYVRRTLYVGSDTDIDELFKGARQFYGSPVFSSYGRLVYGDAFRLIGSGTSPDILDKDTGRGLAIDSEICYSCSKAGEQQVTFTLVDRQADAKAEAAGAKALERRNQEKARSQKF